MGFYVEYLNIYVSVKQPFSLNLKINKIPNVF